jgi:hypothetical protein
MARPRKRNKPAPKAKTTNQVDPPLVSLVDILIAGGETRTLTTVLSYTAPPRERFLAFAERPTPADLSTRPVGNFDDLGEVYELAWTAEVVVEKTAREIYERKLTIPRRPMTAGGMLIAASGVFDSAVLLYLRPEPFCQLGTCALVRSAFEGAATAALVAEGVADEVDRIEKNEPRIEPRESFPVLARLTAAARPGSSDPYKVYHWLCERTHMRHDALVAYMTKPAAPKYEETFAALAFVAWSLAVVTERVTGQSSLAQWPPMPAALPW